ncbi:coatomer subunit gamma NDAI_0A06030 [Naumovozyma dairenensis CBS 421]|uniref:Coatomer subunit gamma n=1 Tax=Naumovozyma dairenensis (strain ATCC 10597 / BCRC 20456 / CBS 421 / NBRC 0211 / NRRL Y-12639) TaxID=1071378 RepID=G0W4M0_NAUDC|nr:hypothetical protein NDAI_0A06030 [Naumovozyma dairenensis CBS 421]CCD22758.1 hypothetical protein NDAI_0A06030 [Naumovozyma dairenensis CBS 421]
MSAQTYKKKHETTISGELPDKMTIYQDCMTTFNESPVNAKRCRILISRLLRLLANGETFPENEATTLFFSISKLFQHKNDSLRQSVYVAIKELSKISEDVLMATSSIMKDVQTGSPLIVPNAIRSLTYVLDESTAFSAERLLRSAIVSRDPAVSSAALITSYNLLPISEATVKRFANETHEAIKDPKEVLGDNPERDYPARSTFITQYHALGLLYELKKNDKLALLKIAQECFPNWVLKSSIAKVELIKVMTDLVFRDPSLFESFQNQLEQWFASRHESVQIECAKMITSFAMAHPSYVSSEFFASTITLLQSMLTVPRPPTLFAALRILNKVSMVSPEKVVICNPELESLINHSNRNISTYAITTLLKTGTDKNISNLISTITKFIHEVSDDFKIIIINAVRTLSLNFPHEWKSILDFLIDILKNSEGGFDYKNSIVEALIEIVSFVPQSKEPALENLCDFIEDCEYNELLVRILHLLGKEGPSTSQPSLYVRHIYNRVVLENSIIRSAAVVALSKFALTKNDSALNESIISLLRRIANDKDDEVRDRATIALKFIESSKENIKAQDLIQSKYSYDLSSLEKKLTTYMSSNEDSFKTPFDASAIPKYTEDEVKAMELKRKQEQLTNADLEGINNEDEEPITKRLDTNTYKGATLDEHEQDLLSTQYIEELLSIEEFKVFGNLINSSKPISLTESEAEFEVRGVKHLFKEHVVLQFNIANTLPDVALDNVSVACISQLEDESQLEELFTIPIERLLPSVESPCYIAYKKPEGIVLDEFVNTLTFTSRELNPDTNEVYEGDEGFQDEYEIDSSVLSAGDYIKSSFVSSFDTAFDELSNSEVAVYNLQEDLSLQDVTNRLITSTSCLPLENSQNVSDSSEHTLKLFGKSALNGSKIALIVRMVKSSKGIALKASGKAEDATLCSSLVNGLL